MQALFLDEHCLATSSDIRLHLFPCPVHNASTYLGTFQSGIRYESTAGTFFSVVLLAWLMQLGGIPAPIKGLRLPLVMWILWMLMQLLQLVVIVCALLLTVLSYVQFQAELRPCMVLGPFDIAVLNLVSLVSLVFQPLILAKFLALLLYYHALYNGVRVWAMGRGTQVSEWEKRTIDKISNAFLRSHFVVFGPVAAFSFAVFVFSGAVAFSFSFLLVMLGLALMWCLLSALLQAVGRLTGKLVESITVPQPSWTRALVIQVLTMLKDSLWFLDASPFPSKRFVDVLGVRL